MRRRRPAQVEAFIDEVGPVDVLVNNAGVIAVGPWQTQTLDDFREMLDIQFWGRAHDAAVLPAMVERGERPHRERHVDRRQGQRAWLLPYNAAKFAAVGFSRGPARRARGHRRAR